MFTVKNDWLSDLYSKEKTWFISGHKSFSIKIGLTKKETVSLRFIANRRKIYTYIFTIGLDFENIGEIKEKLRKSKIARKLVVRFSNIFSKKVHIVLFDLTEELFSVTDDFNNYVDMDSKQLGKYFQIINPDLVKNAGTFKQINKTVNDSFQIWGRKSLSKFIVINDFDIITIKNPTIFELKRVKEDIKQWKPYIDDIANYICLRNICNKNNINLRILAYQNYGEEVTNLLKTASIFGSSYEKEIALHEIDAITKENIKGRYVLCKPNDTAISSGIKPTSVGIEFYNSKNKRQW